MTSKSAVSRGAAAVAAAVAGVGVGSVKEVSWHQDNLQLTR